MMGLKCKVPNTDASGGAMDQHLLTIGAGDNVVRLLPPLIVTDADIAEAVDKLDRACQRARSRSRGLRIDDHDWRPRHFLDISDFDAPR